jgi:5-methylphenazine-1-carboxylate 1-monooxygenase
MKTTRDIAIVGGGLSGLCLALALHERGVRSTVYEAAADLRESGVGTTLPATAMREFQALGLVRDVCAIGIETIEKVFFNRHGQQTRQTPCGALAGQTLPEISIPLGRLHRILATAVRVRCGEHALRLGHRLTNFTQDDLAVTLMFDNGERVRSTVAIGCDGLHSTLRRRFYPGEQVTYAGMQAWRGVTRMAPVLTGKSVIEVGSIDTGRLLAQPIVQFDDGSQLIHWMTQIRSDRPEIKARSTAGRLEDFYPAFEHWTFDWLDAAAMLRSAERVVEYPMMDRDPVARWTFDRIALAGDAAHPLYVSSSDGCTQALYDARSLAARIAPRWHLGEDLRPALEDYEAERLPSASAVVEKNRFDAFETRPPYRAERSDAPAI